MKIIYNDCIDSHPWVDKYKTTLKHISERDYPRKVYFKRDDIHCLNPDMWEADNQGENDCTMDAVIGLRDYDGLDYHQRYLVLVELRMNYENAENLSFSSLKSKIDHTSEIVISPNCIIDKDKYFVFDKKVQPIAKRKFFSWLRAGKQCDNWIAITPTDFEGIIKTEIDVPYIPKYSTDAISSSFGKVDTYDDLYRVLNFWLDQVEYYRKRYNMHEVNHISSSVVKESERILSSEKLEVDEMSNYIIAETLTTFKKYLPPSID